MKWKWIAGSIIPAGTATNVLIIAIELAETVLDDDTLKNGGIECALKAGEFLELLCDCKIIELENEHERY